MKTQTNAAYIARGSEIILASIALDATGEVYSMWGHTILRSGDAWTVETWARDGLGGRASVGTAATRERAVAIFAAEFPEAPIALAKSERFRRENAAAKLAEGIKNAADYRAKTNRMTRALNEAMAKAGCQCRVMIEPDTDMSNGYGDYVGMAVYCDSAEGAMRVAKWIARWEERDYEARGGKYGGSYGDAQSAYSAHEWTAPHGVPFAAFARFRYYSRGD